MSSGVLPGLRCILNSRGNKGDNIHTVVDGINLPKLKIGHLIRFGSHYS